MIPNLYSSILILFFRRLFSANVKTWRHLVEWKWDCFPEVLSITIRQDNVTVWVHIYTSIRLDPVIYHIQQLLSLLVLACSELVKLSESDMFLTRLTFVTPIVDGITTTTYVTCMWHSRALSLLCSWQVYRWIRNKSTPYSPVLSLSLSFVFRFDSR